VTVVLSEEAGAMVLGADETRLTRFKIEKLMENSYSQ
jgi:hypothetical protein